MEFEVVSKIIYHDSKILQENKDIYHQKFLINESCF
jgi:hypothetical protein